MFGPSPAPSCLECAEAAPVRSLGQLGNDSIVQANVPVTVVGLSDAIAVSAGYLHSCAVRQTGAVVCWGAGGGGQLGEGRPWWTTPQAVVWPPS